ncbi:MAG TPA: hypothetical protein VG370_08715 [Chloroflexota bacterium]|nr:hypothetical protein [Chloroflexota bacterium]
MTQDALVPAMFGAALVIFWTAAAVVWLLGRRKPTPKDPSDR